MRYTVSVVTLLGFLMIGMPASAAVHFTPEVAAMVQDAKSFQPLHGTGDLPPTVKALCADYRGGLAEPGKDWEATDSVSNDSLPSRRLIWAVARGNDYIIHYEVGGFGHRSAT